MNCKGAKRDVSSLRMKLKNLKSHNKRSKLDSDEETFEQQVIDEEDGQVKKYLIVKKRKRCKMFTPEENDLLQNLVEKYNECLDTTQTRSAIENRTKSWQSIVDEFNAANLNISRDINELKIKYKNMKSKGTNFKVDNDNTSEVVEDVVYLQPNEIETSPPKLNLVTSTAKKATRNLNSSVVERAKTNIQILDSLEDTDDFDESDDDIDVS